MTYLKIYAPWAIGVTSDLVVVGYDPEMADYDNPRGAIIREKWFVVAESNDGRRKNLVGVTFDDPVQAGFFANLYTGWDPENFGDDVWAEGRPAYGSTAWITSGADQDEIAWEHEMEEMGYGY